MAKEAKVMYCMEYYQLMGQVSPWSSTVIDFADQSVKTQVHTVIGQMFAEARKLPSNYYQESFLNKYQAASNNMTMGRRGGSTGTDPTSPLSALYQAYFITPAHGDGPFAGQKKWSLASWFGEPKDRRDLVPWALRCGWALVHNVISLFTTTADLALRMTGAALCAPLVYARTNFNSESPAKKAFAGVMGVIGAITYLPAQACFAAANVLSHTRKLLDSVANILISGIASIFHWGNAPKPYTPIKYSLKQAASSTARIVATAAVAAGAGVAIAATAGAAIPVIGSAAAMTAAMGAAPAVTTGVLVGAGIASQAIITGYGQAEVRNDWLPSAPVHEEVYRPPIAGSSDKDIKTNLDRASRSTQSPNSLKNRSASAPSGQGAKLNFDITAKTSSPQRGSSSSPSGAVSTNSDASGLSPDDITFSEAAHSLSAPLPPQRGSTSQNSVSQQPSEPTTLTRKNT